MIRGISVVASGIVAAVSLAACSTSGNVTSSIFTPPAIVPTSAAAVPAPGSNPTTPTSYGETVTNPAGAPEYDNLAGGFNGTTIPVKTVAIAICYRGNLYLLSAKYPLYTPTEDYDKGKLDHRLTECPSYLPVSGP